MPLPTLEQFRPERISKERYLLGATSIYLNILYISNVAMIPSEENHLML